MTWLLLACTEPVVPEHFEAPDSPGSFGVVTKEPQEGLQIWYPTEQVEGREADYDDILEAHVAWTQGEPWCPTPRPVVVFSHGSQGIRWQNAFQTERLAAHGYVVVAPDHQGNTLVDNSAPQAEVAQRRPLEVSAAFDALLRELPDCVDPQAGYAAMGHSFGGFTTLAVAGAPLDVAGMRERCAVDPDQRFCDDVEDFAGEELDLSDDRVWAAVPMAPGGSVAFGDRLEQLVVPTLILAADLDEQTPFDEEAEPIFAGIGGEKHMAVFLAGGHMTFTEMCPLLPGFDGCTEDNLPIEEAHPLIDTLTLAWLGQVRGFDAAAWLPPESESLEWR